MWAKVLIFQGANSIFDVGSLSIYYIRSLSLLTDGYDEEAITEADSIVDAIFQAIKQRKQIPIKARIDMYDIVQNEINLPSGTVEQLENLYQLRCGFSAYPAHSKWWNLAKFMKVILKK